MGVGNEKAWEHSHSVFASCPPWDGLLCSTTCCLTWCLPSGHSGGAGPGPTPLRPWTKVLFSLWCLCQELYQGDKKLKLTHWVSYLVLWGHLNKAPSAWLTTIMRFFFHRFLCKVFSFQGSWQGCWPLAVMHILTVCEFLLRVGLSKGGGSDKWPDGQTLWQ